MSNASKLTDLQLKGRFVAVAYCTDINDHWGAALIVASTFGTQAETVLLMEAQAECEKLGFSPMEVCDMRFAIVKNIVRRQPNDWRDEILSSL